MQRQQQINVRNESSHSRIIDAAQLATQLASATYAIDTRDTPKPKQMHNSPLASSKHWRLNPRHHDRPAKETHVYVVQQQCQKGIGSRRSNRSRIIHESFTPKQMHNSPLASSKHWRLNPRHHDRPAKETHVYVVQQQCKKGIGSRRSNHSRIIRIIHESFTPRPTNQQTTRRATPTNDTAKQPLTIAFQVLSVAKPPACWKRNTHNNNVRKE
jgi:uncharacterized protein YegP (UPF0339 family)